MNNQQKLIAALIKEIAAARSLITETEKALAESETALIENLGEKMARFKDMTSVDQARVFPGLAESDIDWNLVGIARVAARQRMKNSEVA